MADIVRARVELRGSMSHTARGRTFKKGQPQILTNEGDIAFYQGLNEFSVKLLAAPAAPKKAKAKETSSEDETRPGMESAVMAAEERKRSTDSGEGESEGGSKKKKTKKRSSRG